jgi:hypothetical protein
MHAGWQHIPDGRDPEDGAERWDGMNDLDVGEG